MYGSIGCTINMQQSDLDEMTFIDQGSETKLMYDTSSGYKSNDRLSKAQHQKIDTTYIPHEDPDPRSPTSTSSFSASSSLLLLRRQAPG